MNWQKIVLLTTCLCGALLLSGCNANQWELVSPVAGGKLFISGARIFLIYIAIAGFITFGILMYNINRYEESIFWEGAFRMFKLFWIPPLIFFFLVLAVLLIIELGLLV